MDPLALAAVVGLVFAGKKISDSKEEQAVMPKPPPPAPEQTTKFDLVRYKFAQQDPPIDQLSPMPNSGRGFSGGMRLPPKEAVRNLGDIVPDGKRFPFGQPVYTPDASREPVTNKLNNVNPADKVFVGRGLGLDPNVPASGGFHQYFRVLPNNMNEERLTQLQGNWGGPASPIVKNGGTTMGAISHPAKLSKTTEGYQPMQTRGQGQGGAITGPEQRPDFQKTRRTTNRQETGLRKDGLEMGPGQYMVYEHYGSAYRDPMRWSDNRVNPDRAGNPGRMNVRADPLGANGAVSKIRLEGGSLPVRPADASRGSRYIPNQYDKLNVFKGNADPRTKNLGLASNVLKNNPFNHTLSAQPEVSETPLVQPVN